MINEHLVIESQSIYYPKEMSFLTCASATQFQGYIAGNPATFPAQLNFTIPFSHGMGLISDELFEVSTNLSELQILRWT